MTPWRAAILGALTADAASLGLHWLYDAPRLRQLQLAGPLAMRSPDTTSYAGAPGYFAHSGKRAGDVSPYDESCGRSLMLGARCAADAAVQGVANALPQVWLQQLGAMPMIEADLQRLGC